MGEFSKVDRDAVEKFFTWKSLKWNFLIGGIAGMLIGLWAFAVGFELLGLISLIFGIYLVSAGVRSESTLKKYYDEVQKAKLYDFSKVLVRSFTRTEIDLDTLLDFDATDLVSIDPNAVPSANKDMMAELDRKSVFLFGRENSDRWRLLRVGGHVVLEYSPIFVSILYLTRSELIIYFADIDITRGDLQIEEINRAFLHEVVQITASSKSTRIKRAANEEIFNQFENLQNSTAIDGSTHAPWARYATQSRQMDEIIYYEHEIRVSMTNGRTLSLPVGAPEYRSGKKGLLDETEEDEDRFTRIAREIFKRINDAKRMSDDTNTF